MPNLTYTQWCCEILGCVSQDVTNTLNLGRSKTWYLVIMLVERPDAYAYKRRQSILGPGHLQSHTFESRASGEWDIRLDSPRSCHESLWEAHSTRLQQHTRLARIPMRQKSLHHNNSHLQNGSSSDDRFKAAREHPHPCCLQLVIHYRPSR